MCPEWVSKTASSRRTRRWRTCPPGPMSVCVIYIHIFTTFTIFTIFTVPAYRLQIDQSVTAQKIQPIGTIGADGAEAFKSKLKFQIQHEVFRCCNISYRSQTYSQTFHPAE